MENIRFSIKEHMDFYCQMLVKTRNDIPYHRELFFTKGICEETRRNNLPLFFCKNGGINQDGLLASWQAGSTRRLCRLAFTSGSAGQKKERKTASRPTNCLIAALHRIFLNPSACVIPNIVGAWNVPFHFLPGRNDKIHRKFDPN